MIIYVFILIVLHILNIGYVMNQDDNGEKFLMEIGSILAFLPVYGRVLGWW